jgi:hypothetical protein
VTKLPTPGRTVCPGAAGVSIACRDKLIAQGVEPFTCVPANLIALAIEDKLDRPVELAEIKVESDACQLLLVVFEARPTLE